jgi:ubiquinone/menaquinone biosynthesis C-methylase UbiE
MPRETVEKVRHPLFARLYERVAATAEGRGADEHRRTLLVGLEGRVIEVGAGNGANLPHYPSTVTELVAVEPEPYLRARAAEAAAEVSIPVRVVDGVAGELPADEASFDAGVVSLVLCSVPDQVRALDELRRVIRPGGELRFYEHVISRKPLFARLERIADATLWPRVAGGCHLSRDTGAAIERAGFAIEDVKRFPFSPAPVQPAIAHVLGRARRPDAGGS